MKTVWIYALAFALASVVPAMIVGIVFGLIDGWLFFFAAIFFGVPLAAQHIVFIGFPTFLVLRHLGLISWRISVMAGFVIGCTPMGLILWAGASGTTGGAFSEAAAIILSLGTLGAIGGLIFWLVIRRTIEDTLA